MIGAIAGDMIGSRFEARPVKSTDFPLFAPGSRFTDDSVLTVAVARAILEDGDYLHHVHALGRRYPDADYGARFVGWLQESEPRPYGSWGNGAAMRVSPVGFAFSDVDRVLAEAARSAAISHDHPEGLKGAQAVALGKH
ncbi:ADP-ribosylglycohydrolase family protein [Thioalkalivibrio sp.]|uniref:ADP-ribosylglycohydrolase family protein n=1 Tax=Thioalkalivibrio sp. TaxID=2093813 RepID=UPI0035675C74